MSSIQAHQSRSSLRLRSICRVSGELHSSAALGRLCLAAVMVAVVLLSASLVGVADAAVPFEYSLCSRQFTHDKLTSDSCRSPFRPHGATTARKQQGWFNIANEFGNHHRLYFRARGLDTLCLSNPKTSEQCHKWGKKKPIHEFEFAREKLAPTAYRSHVLLTRPIYTKGWRLLDNKAPIHKKRPSKFDFGPIDMQQDKKFNHNNNNKFSNNNNKNVKPMNNMHYNNDDKKRYGDSDRAGVPHVLSVESAEVPQPTSATETLANDNNPIDKLLSDSVVEFKVENHKQSSAAVDTNTQGAAKDISIKLSENAADPAVAAEQAKSVSAASASWVPSALVVVLSAVAVLVVLLIAILMVVVVRHRYLTLTMDEDSKDQYFTPSDSSSTSAPSSSAIPRKRSNSTSTFTSNNAPNRSSAPPRVSTATARVST